MSIMISIKPKYVEKILNGEKTLEVRTTIPKEWKEWVDYTYSHITHFLKPFPETKCYIYETKSKNGAGKVVGEFTANSIKKFEYENMDYPTALYDGDHSITVVGSGYFITGEELNKTCLTYDEFEKYGKGKTSYGIDISNVIEHNEYENSYWQELENYIGKNGKPLKRAPQSWCYVEEI